MSFNEYVNHGWKLCAIMPGTKGPKDGGWQTKERATEGQVYERH